MEKFRSKDKDIQVRSNIIILDIITGEDNDNCDRGRRFDNARFYIYEEIFKGRINDDNIDVYIDLYKRLSDDDIEVEDDGQIRLDSILE